MKKKGLLIFLLIPQLVLGQTIAEKKASFYQRNPEVNFQMQEELKHFNTLLDERRFELKTLYSQAQQLLATDSQSQAFLPLLEQIKRLKHEINEMQEMWREEISSSIQNEGYALWQAPEATLQQLVMEYGSSDFIYLIPPEIGQIQISLNSNLPIPRESWNECLELILSQYGIGIRQLNPYLRELFIARNDPSGIEAIVVNEEELPFFPSHTRVCYLLTSRAPDPRSDFHLLERFCNPMTTRIDLIGGKVFITGPVNTIRELLKIHGFVQSNGGAHDMQLVTLAKIEAREMQTILNAAFFKGKGGSEDETTLIYFPLESLPQSLFLSGSQEEIQKALKLIQEVEAQVADPQEKSLFWYTVKHSQAEELASVLSRVYDLLVNNPKQSAASDNGASLNELAETETDSDERDSPQLIVPSINIVPKDNESDSLEASDRNNFIVDPKTGSIIMVVKQQALGKIKDLLKKLDVPKKMVQLEVLLFEKKVSSQNKIGLNLLRLGSDALNATWNAGSPVSAASGILNFLISHKKGSGIPAYDLSYQFLLGQEDVQINASPSIVTMNQTPATIAIVEEISIDAGTDKKNKHLYDRAQYGITIQITPTINAEENCSDGFVTLDTDITFDTTKKNPEDRPDVTRRHIQNHVRIADGETLILGGLRRKNSQDNKESIPFLGEIPGIGKLFSHTEMNDNSTEMFIFITPKIIADPIEDARRIRREMLNRRPGDIPEYLHELVLARERQRKRFFEGTLRTLFGRSDPLIAHHYSSSNYYEGR